MLFSCWLLIRRSHCSLLGAEYNGSMDMGSLRDQLAEMQSHFSKVPAEEFEEEFDAEYEDMLVGSNPKSCATPAERSMGNAGPSR